ncbi:hypothetical protein FA15DRAFT_617573 [Coprinopsis marcescibilis]|uniref:Uncharacterized protein n=1 Tax=Coprinopsis marcescibilis TaxID=230819 RepID=A0A5C3KY84_COPMA|nr:hypothetical protein FA15DRAFT_617573 [Coprinopsis marcescibilis]
MPSKGHRSNSTGRLGVRTSSATKLTTNLQFTQKEPHMKHSDKQKKSSGYGNDKVPAFTRTNSNQRIHSGHMQPMKRGNSSQKINPGKVKGFTIASPTGEEDDDEWVSSSSGVATPNQNDSDSEEETASEDGGSDTTSQRILRGQMSSQNANQAAVRGHTAAAALQRVDTARQTDFAPSTLRGEIHKPVPQTVNLSSHSQALPNTPFGAEDNHPEVDHLHSQLRNLEFESAKETRPELVPHVQHSPRATQGRRTSRPASTYSAYSASGTSDIRPHPLIRGQSFGHSSVGKPSPLGSLTVSGVAPPQLSTSPTSATHEEQHNFLSTSPASTVGSENAAPWNRRTSFSSARSVATLPNQFRSEQPRPFDRTRTTSTMSASSSSAALAALSHLPTVTRPPSPQSIVFFPPVNPYSNTENIHPLLPGPYLNNHLTVLSRRIPLRESYDRVIWAKQAL